MQYSDSVQPKPVDTFYFSFRSTGTGTKLRTRSKQKSAYEKAVSYVTDPVGTAKAIKNAVVTYMSSKLLFPTPQTCDWQKRRIELSNSLNGQQVQINCSNGTTLGGMFFQSNAQENNPLAKKAIIFAPGADGYYEDSYSEYFVKMLKQKLGDINVLIVNYPSVMESKGILDLSSCSQTVIASFKYLQDKKKLDANDIIIWGQSMGGLASLLGAKTLQQTDGKHQIKIVNERSGIDITQAISQVYGGGVKGWAAAMALKICGWNNYNFTTVWNGIHGSKLIIYSAHDGIVLKANSVFNAVQKRRSHNKETAIEMAGDRVQSQEHLRHFTSEEEEAICSYLKGEFGIEQKEKTSDTQSLKVIKVALPKLEKND